MFEFFPIAYVRNDRKELYQVPFQTGLINNFESVIELNKNDNYEEALQDLEGMERIWVMFVFHKAKTWKPKIYPPRGKEKRGLFATRSPHRPNPIGMSAVKLKRIEGLKLYIEDHDFIDGTPVLDIKPYLPYVDSFPEAKYGWLENESMPQAFSLKEEESFSEKRNFLIENSGPDLLSLIDVNLSLNPFPRKGNRIEDLENGQYKMAIKTWRVIYRVEATEVFLEDIFSGYESEFIDGTKKSKWDDIEIHRSFLAEFGQK
ncbi:MAG: tRNA (N6-threonylcarbamoyladenosine(37)-N6)-methyltransferase TrmO [Lentisphaeraceae bacterium]|nr:tRNA (N6-threonylcarbamoyladenosine(37)-N6)-methyltransferase TrmO [Lentisphaeraceae bacterium]